MKLETHQRVDRMNFEMVESIAVLVILVIVALRLTLGRGPR